MRLVVTVAAAFIAWKTYEQNNQSGWIWVFGLVALLFNPLIPIYLDKEIWMIIDSATAILFLFYSRKVS